MISLQDLKQELTDAVIDRFYDRMDNGYLDDDELVGEFIEDVADKKVADDLFENKKEHVAVILSEQNLFFDRKDLRDDFIYELNHGLADDMFYEADKADFEMLGIENKGVSFEDMSHDELGKYVALAEMTVGTTPFISAYGNEAIDTFIQDICARAEDQLIDDKMFYPDMRMSDCMIIHGFLKDKSLDDLISDVKIEDKEVKEKQDREIDER